MVEPEHTKDTGDARGVFARQGKLIAAVIVLVSALGYFGFTAFQSATVYSYSVSELTAIGPTPDGKFVRVNGNLLENSFTRPDGSTLAHFTITDETDVSQSIPARYNGVLPDLFFNPHSEIILEGSYGADGVFVSQNVLVKCPSKYIDAESADDQPPADYNYTKE